MILESLSSIRRLTSMTTPSFLPLEEYCESEEEERERDQLKLDLHFSLFSFVLTSCGKVA